MEPTALGWSQSPYNWSMCLTYGVQPPDLRIASNRKWCSYYCIFQLTDCMQTSRVPITPGCSPAVRIIRFPICQMAYSHPVWPLHLISEQRNCPEEHKGLSTSWEQLLSLHKHNGYTLRRLHQITPYIFVSIFDMICMQSIVLVQYTTWPPTHYGITTFRAYMFRIQMKKAWIIESGNLFCLAQLLLQNNSSVPTHVHHHISCIRTTDILHDCSCNFFCILSPLAARPYLFDKTAALLSPNLIRSAKKSTKPRSTG